MHLLASMYLSAKVLTPIHHFLLPPSHQIQYYYHKKVIRFSFTMPSCGGRSNKRERFVLLLAVWT